MILVTDQPKVSVIHNLILQIGPLNYCAHVMKPAACTMREREEVTERNEGCCEEIETVIERPGSPPRLPQTPRHKPRDVSKNRHHHTTNEQNSTEPAQIIAPNGISFPHDAAWFDAMYVCDVCVRMCVGRQWFLAPALTRL